MLTVEQIKELAHGQQITGVLLDERLRELRSDGATILLCIMFVKENHKCSLNDACDIVTSSDAWADRREGFYKEQQEAFEEFIEDNADCVESIHQEISMDGVRMTAHMRRDR